MESKENKSKVDDPPPIIHKTTNYGQFIILDENREIIKPHLKKLSAAISVRNFLRLFPIIVNDKLHVIEGQHRLRSAEQLQLPIYYIIDNDITSADIALVNNNRKSWTAKEYIRFYAKKGNKSYIHLHKLLTDYPRISVTCAIRLSDKNKGDYFGGGGETQTMREGKIECVSAPMANLIAQTCKTLSEKRTYAFDALFMLNIKKAILNSGNTPIVCCNTLLAKRHMLPLVLEKLESCLPILKSIMQ